MRSSKDEASTSTEMLNTRLRSRADLVLDFISAVKGLHELSSQQLGKIIRDSGNNFLRHIAEDGSRIQIDVEKFARYLPLHLISVIMAWKRDKSTFKYLLCGILLLHNMCDLASRMPKIEQILLDDLKVSEQLIDLVFYLLVVLGSHRQEDHLSANHMVLLHSALVACSLKLLTVIVSPNFQEVAQVLSAYHKIDIFMDAAFTAVSIDVDVLKTKLADEDAESLANTIPTAEQTLDHLFQQCDSSLLLLQSLCQQKLFQELVARNKELCSNGGVLVLVHSVMSLNISPLYSGTSSYMTSVSQLKAKALSILLHLCEAESVSYLDEVASTPGCQNLGNSIALQILELLKKIFGIDSQQSTGSSEVFYSNGQLELNAMRLADTFSDDSNFRSVVVINFTEALVGIFLLPHGEFLSAWCSSDLPICEDNATLDEPQASYAHQRTSLLIKLMGNLHCFVPHVCQADEKDLFLNKFVSFLRADPQNPSNGPPFTVNAEKTTIVGKNLRSLLSHAESLLPRFLNEDDIKLLRLFIGQFEPLCVPVVSEDHTVQAEVVPNNENGDITMEHDLPTSVAVQEGDQLHDGGNGSDKFSDEMEQGKASGATIILRGPERDTQIVETSGSDSSPMHGKNIVDRMDVDNRGSGFEETIEDEKVDVLSPDEKLQRRRKRTVMNDKQIALIEAALVDEHDMHRNASSLRLWAEKLSVHGAEVTTSRLKNWLNNRKARLARAAKDVRISYERDNLDKQGGSGQLSSPRSSSDDAHIPSGAKGSVTNEVIDTPVRSSIDEDMGTSVAEPPRETYVAGPPREILRATLHFETGQYVMLVGEKGDEVGRGRVFQVHGKWCGYDLEQSGACVVDIIELSADRFSKLPHPTEFTGTSFDQAEKRLGVMRVLWDLNKMFLFLNWRSRVSSS